MENEFISKGEIFSLTQEIYPQIAALRHQLHEQPELGGQEVRTSKLVLHTLNEWGIRAEQIPGSTAVIGSIIGDLPSRVCIALRAEMDALPIDEASGVPYTSQIPHVMHACGHDMNTSNLLGTAWMLQKLRPYFGGTVKLIFQPAEEICGGVKEILDYGVLSDAPQPLAILAAHVSPRYALGQIAVREGFSNMAASSFAITLHGRGGHAASPHRSDDLVLIAAELITRLQQIQGHLVNHIEPALLVVSFIQSDGIGNVLPRTVRFSGTVRAQTKEIHDVYQAQMEKLLKAEEMCLGIKAELDFHFGTPAMYNSPELTKAFKQAEEDLLGVQHVIAVDRPTNGSENFAEFSSRIPAVYFHIGGVQSQNTGRIAVHSAEFCVDDLALQTGVPAMAWAALCMLQGKHGFTHV